MENNRKIATSSEILSFNEKQIADVQVMLQHEKYRNAIISYLIDHGLSVKTIHDSIIVEVPINNIV